MFSINKIRLKAKITQTGEDNKVTPINTNRVKGVYLTDHEYEPVDIILESWDRQFNFCLETENIPMNRIMLKAAAIALPMVLGTAIADDTQQSQDAMNGLVPMTSSELATVTGANYLGGYGYGYGCYECSNYATATQVNLSGLSALVAQANLSGITQSNN